METGNVFYADNGIHSFEWYEKIKTGFPSLQSLISNALGTGNGAEAIAARSLDLELLSNRESVDLLLTKAYLLNRGTNYYGAQAQRDFTLRNVGTRLISLDTTRYEGYLIVGTFLSRLYSKYRYSRVDQRREQAIQDRIWATSYLTHATNVEPNNPCPHIALVAHLIEIGDLERADVASSRFEILLPQFPQAWLLKGLTKTLLGDYKTAELQFGSGLALLSPGEKDKFLDISDLIVAEEINNAEWQFEDPYLLTRENERLTSHYARLVYSDLYFPLWRKYLSDDDYITPGEVVVRYGFPRFRNVSPGASQNGLAKRLDMFIPSVKPFQFEDEYNSGDWVIESDSVIDNKSVFFKQPNTPDPPTKQPFDIPFTVSFLKNDAAGVDVLVTTGVPVLSTIQNASFLDYTEGIFLRDENMSIVSRSILDERLPAERYKIQIDSFDVWTKTTIHETEEIPAEVIVEAETPLQVAALTTVPDHELDFSKFSISSPVLSSLVEEHFGEGSKKAPLQRKGFDIYPLPVRLVPPSKQIYIYFEVYNLPLAEAQVGDAGFDLTIQLTKFSEPKGAAANIFGRLRDLVLRPETTRVAVSITYSDNAKDQAKYVILDLDDYESGYYQLDLLVLDKSGRNTAKSSSEIWIR